MFDLNWARLDALKAKLDDHRPLSKDIVNNLHDNLVLSWTYHSNATTGITDLDGTPLVNNYSWSFTTGDGGWGDAGQIEPDDFDEADLPQVAFDSSGSALAVWQQSDDILANRSE